MKKRLFCIYMVTTLLLALCVPAHGAVVRQIMEERVLVKGVTYQHIQQLEEYGWQDIHVVQADLTSPGISLEVLKSNRGESYLETTYNMAVASDTVAALNADFFAAKRGESGRGSAVGVEIRDGELKSSASVEENMNTLYKVFDEERFHINAFTFDITVTAANGMTDKIKLVNKYDDLTGIVMYTDDWAETSVGSTGGIIEVSVDSKGTVVEKVMESEPITIPEGGYVLSAHMSYNTFLLDHVQVGDKISVNVTSTPNAEYIETAIGGGGVIVHEGKVPTSFSHNITGRNPRSAVGLDKNGTMITLVAVDGRRSDAKGMTQTELGKLMIELGCFTALNFDGGGSTAMILDNNGKKEVANTPSDGSVRKVTNALGVVADVPDTAPVTTIKIESEDTVFFKTSIPLSVIGIDAYQRETTIPNGKITYSAKNGTIKNGLFYPDSTGKAEISASYGRIKATKEITVLNAPREMNFSKEKVSLKKGETYEPVLIGKDDDGNCANVRLSDVSLAYASGIVKVNNETVTGISKGATVLSATFGDVVAHMAVMVDGAAEIGVPENIVIPDEKNIYSPLQEDGAFRFAVFGNTRESKTLFDRFLMNTAMYKMKADSKFQVFLGANIYLEEIERVCTDYVTAKQYNCFGDEFGTFITVPNVSGMIYNGDTSVWTKLRQDASRAEKNVFIFLDRNFISNHPAELKTFTEIVNAVAQQGKNVYVFGGGFVNQNTITSKVRYVNTAGIFPSIALEGTSPSYIKYVLVTVNGDDVTFEYKPILGE